MDEQQVEVIVEEAVDSARGFEPKLEARNMTFGPGFAGGAIAQQDMTMTDAGAVGVAVGRDMQLNNGGAFAIAVGHDLELMNGGSNILTVGEHAELTNGGAMVAISRQVTAQNSFFGVLISRQAQLESGSRVLLNTKQAAIFGATFGAALALLSWLLRKK